MSDTISIKIDNLHKFFRVYDYEYDDELGAYLDVQRGMVLEIAHYSFHALERKENLFAMPLDEAISTLKRLATQKHSGIQATMLDECITALHIDTYPDRYLTVPHLGVGMAGIKYVSNYELVRRFMGSARSMHPHLKQLLRSRRNYGVNKWFDSFEDTLTYFPASYGKWVAFKQKHWQKLVREWLEGHGFSVVFA
ncbi:MAG: hypothetical protein AAFV98_04585 [Chloroflexota bacterium]